MEPNQGIKSWQWIVTVIVIIILIVLGYYMLKGKSANAPSENVTDTEVIETDTTNELSRVMVSDQYPGNVVNISSAQFANPGFVTIHEDKDGAPGDIIGSLYFEKGINTRKITLSKSTVEGKMYYAMLHSDDGDKKFDAVKDLPIKNSRGNVIMKTFQATSNITEIKA